MASYLFDAEFDGLEPTKIHVLTYQRIGTQDKKSLYHYQDIINFFLYTLKEKDYLVGHNITLFDVPQIERLLGIEIKNKLVDTLALSWYLFPSRLRHGLEEWGTETGLEKVLINDWNNLSKEEYTNRCEQDVSINLKLWEIQKSKLVELYGSLENSISIINYLSFKLKCVQIAEKNCWKLDLEKAHSFLEELTKEEEEKLKILIQLMPEREVYVCYKKPKQKFKKDGEHTNHWKNWLKRCKETGVNPETGEETKVFKGLEEPNPGSSQQVKEWLFSLGWKPCSFKKNDKGKKIPQINSQDPSKKGELSDSVLKLAEKNEGVKVLSGLSVLQHRKSIIKGFIRDQKNGRLKASIVGFTNTLRFKHTELVNLPSISSVYGNYIRPLLIAPEGCELCGVDIKGLEDRTKQHFMFPFDPDYVKEMDKPDFDPHLDIALLTDMLTLEEVSNYKRGIDQEKVKPVRHIAKTTNYTCTYGGGIPRISESAGISRKKAAIFYNTYWERNYSIKLIEKSVEIRELENGELWLFNPVSKFWYSLRNKKDIFSTLNQGTGSYVFDTLLTYVLSQTNNLIGQFHDELILVIKKGERHIVKDVLLKSINAVNNKLKLNKNMDIDIQFGDNYGEIH